MRRRFLSSFLIGASLACPGVAAFAQSQFESSKISPGVVIRGADLESSKMSAGVVTQNTDFQSSKISVGVVVNILVVGGNVIHAPLTHW